MNKMVIGLTLLLFLATVEYRFDFGILSVAIVEPFALLFAAAILGPKLLRREPLNWRNPYFLLFAGITFWALIMRPFSPDWKHGLSDVRDWLIPTLVFFALLNLSRASSHDYLTAFVIVISIISVVGIYQYFTDSFRPFIIEMAAFKQEGNVAVGFFGSPNGTGMFLAAGIPFYFAWLRSNGQRFGWYRYSLLALPIAAHYFTFSRTSLLVVAIMAGVLILHYTVRSTRTFVYLLGMVAIIGFIVVFLGLEFLPHEPIRTLWWRIALWEIASITLQNYPFIWVTGNGIDRFITLSFYPQPHNQYIFMLLEYGVVGIVVMGGIVGWTLFSGLRARTQGYFQQYPALAPIWIGICGQFLNAMTESTWLSLNGRLLFIYIITSYVTMLIEANPTLIRLPSIKLPSIPSTYVPGIRERHS